MLDPLFHVTEEVSGAGHALLLDAMVPYDTMADRSQQRLALIPSHQLGVQYEMALFACCKRGGEPLQCRGPWPTPCALEEEEETKNPSESPR
jgi:hypothetical protein